MVCVLWKLQAKEMLSEEWKVKNPYVKWKVKSEKWRIQWFKWGYRKKGVLGNAQPNLLFSFCSINPCPSSHVLLFSCLPKNMFFCSLVSPQKTCSLVLMSFKKTCSSVLLSPQKPCSSVLMSFKKHVLLSNSRLRGTVRRPYLLRLFLFPPNHPAQQSCL